MCNQDSVRTGDRHRQRPITGAILSEHPHADSITASLEEASTSQPEGRGGQQHGSAAGRHSHDPCERRQRALSEAEPGRAATFPSPFFGGLLTYLLTYLRRNGPHISGASTTPPFWQ